MEKTNQVEIENDYKNQVQILEEELQLIGEYEADLKKGRVKRGFNRLLNLILANIILILAIAGVVSGTMYRSQVLDYINTCFYPDKLFLQVYGVTLKITVLIQIIYGLVVVMLFSISFLIDRVRRKNRFLRKLFHIVSVLKKNSVDRLGHARQRHKHAMEFVAENRNRV